MRLQSLMLVGFCLIALAGCGSESPSTASPEVSGQANDAVHQGDTALNAPANASASGNYSNARPAGGSTAGGDIAEGMRVPDRPNRPRRGNQSRPTNSGGTPARSSPAGGVGDQPEAPVIPDQLASDMADARYTEFTRMCGDLFALRDEMKPLELALAVGTATPDQVKRFNELEVAARREHQRLNRYTWNDRWSADDRRVMAMIMSMPR